MDKKKLTELLTNKVNDMQNINYFGDDKDKPGNYSPLGI